jgi:hypothetical protein
MSDAKVRFFNETKKGDCAVGSEVFFSFTCPNGNTCGWLPILGRTNIPHDPQNKNGGKAHWGWDGNRESPTLTPSIDCGGCWHGFIENGRCVSVSKIDEPEPKAPGPFNRETQD